MKKVEKGENRQKLIKCNQLDHPRLRLLSKNHNFMLSWLRNQRIVAECLRLTQFLVSYLTHTMIIYMPNHFEPSTQCSCASDLLYRPFPSFRCIANFFSEQRKNSQLNFNFSFQGNLLKNRCEFLFEFMFLEEGKKNFTFTYRYKIICIEKQYNKNSNNHTFFIHF